MPARDSTAMAMAHVDAAQEAGRVWGGDSSGRQSAQSSNGQRDDGLEAWWRGTVAEDG